jgi:hypothetical protein
MKAISWLIDDAEDLSRRIAQLLALIVDLLDTHGVLLMHSVTGLDRVSSFTPMDFEAYFPKKYTGVPYSFDLPGADEISRLTEGSKE